MPPDTLDRPVATIEPWHGTGPAAAAALLRGRRGLAWLDSALAHAGHGRWSVVASDPRWTIAARPDEVLHASAGGTRRLPAGALHALARAIEGEPHVIAPDVAAGRGAGGTADAPALPFLGGAIGYIAYEAGREVERLPATTVDDIGAPVLAFGWYDAALVWDGLRSEGWLAGRADGVAALRARLADSLPIEVPPADASRDDRACVPLTSNFTRDAYLEAVARAQRYICAGDIYQVNLSQRFTARAAAEGFDLYHRLRAVSPAPFAAYLDLRDAAGVEVLSSSPERFLLADGDHLETRPIKGTRPRGATPAEDARLAEALRRSVKDGAEHLMIVDLERNDLGRVAAIGSVRVSRFATPETYAQVHHLTSTVEARRRPDVGLEALLRATFPGGSVTGAPKVRALEIIDELEPTARGIYTGAIGYISAHGRVDLNVAIRTITIAHGVAHFHVGGAIVHDSSPTAEYAETLDKARGMARALGVVLPDEAPPPAVAVATPVAATSPPAR